MNRFVLFVVVVVFGGVSTLVLGNLAGNTDGQLSADSIVEKNVAARGGLNAWRKINTMTWVGHIDINSTKAPVHHMPFALKMKRPNKTRFEIVAQHQLSVRLYDGEQGWKMLPGGPDGLPRLKPYSQDELRFAHDAQGFDGPLIDYKNKGIAVSLEGVDQVEGHKAYRLKVTMPSGNSHHVWIDAKTFLDIKYDRKTRNAFGMTATLSVTYRDYRTVNGLQIPFTIKSGTGPGKPSYNMVIDKVLINPALNDLEFSKPNIPHRNSSRIRLGAVPTGPTPHTAWPMKPVSPGRLPTAPSVAGATGGR